MTTMPIQKYRAFPPIDTFLLVGSLSHALVGLAGVR